jgi:hypothetical protein
MSSSSVVVFDRFKKRDDNNPNHTYILTHAHTDHSSIPLSFKSHIHCSPLTRTLLLRSEASDNHRTHLAATLIGSLIVGRDVTLTNNIKVHVFDNNHCIGSVGVFVYDTGHLHYGEGRVHFDDFSTHVKPHFRKTVVKHVTGECPDYTMSLTRLPHEYPTMADTRRTMLQLLTSRQRNNPTRYHVVIRHFALVAALPQTHDIRYVWSSKTTTKSQRLIKTVIDMQSQPTTKSNHVVSVGSFRKPLPFLNIVPSMNAFGATDTTECASNLHDINDCGLDDSGNYVLRVFAATHASKAEQIWLRRNVLLL